jgi:hypothetical protein
VNNAQNENGAPEKSQERREFGLAAKYLRRELSVA